MSINLDDLWPYIVGGLIISFAITLNLSITKRLISLSTIFHDLLTPERPDFSWKSSTLAGLIFASTLVWNIAGFGTLKDTKIHPFEPEHSFLSGLGIYGFLFSGFLVGCGTKVAGGGITGHVFCGIPRLSIKSLIAVPCFLGTAFGVATMKNKSSLFTGHDLSCASLDIDPTITVNIFLATSAILVVYSLIKNLDQEHGIIGTIVSFGSGAILAIGLMASGMAQRSKMLDLLTLKETWILFVFATVIVVNLISFNVIFRKKLGPLSHPHIINIIIGSIIFGAGLGLSGLTPGTALIVAPVYFPEILVFFLLPASFGHQFAGYISKFSEAVRGADVSDNYGQF